MPLLTSELFAQFLYSPDLTYEDLNSREEHFRRVIEDLFTQYSGQHIQFDCRGDSLHAQCVFPAHDEQLCHAVCDRVAPFMDGLMEARLLFIRKDLSLLSVYTIAEKKWQEALLELPYAGTIGRSIAGS